MVISYEGVEFFRVQYGDVVIAFNPISKNSKFKGRRFGADIALVTTNHQDFNGIDSVTLGDKKPFAVTGPGEYEYKGVSVQGLPSESKYGGEAHINTVYLVSLEDINLCFLGALSKKELPKELTEAIDEVDILFVPIGGDRVLGAAESYELAVSLEPKLIIPMHFGEVGVKNALSVFLKEGGDEKTEKLDKLTIKKKDIEGKEGDIAVLVPAS